MPDQPDEIGVLVGHVLETVPRLLVDRDLPRLAVGVCDRSGVLWSAGFGRTARGGGGPITTRTLPPVSLPQPVKAEAWPWPILVDSSQLKPAGTPPAATGASTAGRLVQRPPATSRTVPVQ